MLITYSPRSPVRSNKTVGKLDTQFERLTLTEGGALLLGRSTFVHLKRSRPGCCGAVYECNTIPDCMNNRARIANYLKRAEADGGPLIVSSCLIQCG